MNTDFLRGNPLFEVVLKDPTDRKELLYLGLSHARASLLRQAIEQTVRKNQNMEPAAIICKVSKAAMNANETAYIAATTMAVFYRDLKRELHYKQA